MSVRLPAAFALAVAVGYGSVAQDAAPLPDAEVLFNATRENLARAQREQRFFAYKERRTEIRANPFGRIGTGGTRVYEVTPMPGGRGMSRRLLERDGKPVANAEVERIERGNRNAPRRTGRSALDDAIAMLELRVDRREREGDRSFIIINFAPRPDGKPETREGRLARNFKGEVRVDEHLHEVVRIDATAIDDIAYGMGLVARLNEGSEVSVVRQQVEPNLWLPTSLRFQGQGRALVFRKLIVDYRIDWWDYRREGSR
jgi:hypothetical protein